jgi:hypothetical protein
MCFEIANGDFGCIPAMASRRHEFNVELVFFLDV